MTFAVMTFEEGLRTGNLAIESSTDESAMPVSTWSGKVGHAELSLLEKCVAPVLDVGCGPGRMVGWLAEHGLEALGVDVSPLAVDLTRRRGGEAILADVLAGEAPGGHATIILVDGNIGIGGNPTELLRRCRELLAPEGQILVEVGAPGSGSGSELVRLVSPESRSEEFLWARLDLTDLPRVAFEAQMEVAYTWQVDGRYLARLTR